MPIEQITIAPGKAEPYIRGVRFWNVYRDLVFHGMTEDQVLQKYSQLAPDDLVAVRDYAVHLIKTRTHDEITGRRILAKVQLRHGEIYKGRCRNATIARWNGEEQCFYHWREKFGRIYIETIRYPTDEKEPWWDVFDVVELLPVCRFEIPFDQEAVFAGNQDDLYEHNPEMWRRLE